MNKRNRILICPLFAIGMFLMLVTGCKKDDKNNNNNNGWTEQEHAAYNEAIALQDQAMENYSTWSQTMDSLEAINALQQFFLGDSSVSFAIIGSQGIAVQYKNGMRGGIFLNPKDCNQADTTKSNFPHKMQASNINEKSVVNIKKAIFINPHYWEREEFSDPLASDYYRYLPKAGYSLRTIINQEATVNCFTQLSGYGFIHVYSHGWAWPKEQNMSDVYLKTGERESENTSEKYWADIKNGDIAIFDAKVSSTLRANVYFISKKFVCDHNDFSKDTVLFYGGFCYSFLGTWPEIERTFAKGAYFGFPWAVDTWWSSKWARSLICNMTDTSASQPFTTERWMNNSMRKSYWDNIDMKTVSIQYTGDATLTLWTDTIIETKPITNIAPTTATGGGNIKSDGGFPITARGVCWSTSSNPTVSDSHTSNGSGTGSFTSNITGLTLNTFYYVRAYATNSAGTMYGNQVSFTTMEGHYIGESFGGGIIFYIDGTGQHGLISATINQTDIWTTAHWGCDTTLIGCPSTAIGTGQANTMAIINGCAEAGIAARLCNDLELNGYSDWFLPSIDELHQMYIQKDVIGGFGTSGYWSSTEDTWKGSAWYQSFSIYGTGSPFAYSKNNPLDVRAIRAF